MEHTYYSIPLLNCGEEYVLALKDEESESFELGVRLDEICYDITRFPNHYRLSITKGKPPYNTGGFLIVGLDFLNDGVQGYIHEPSEVYCRIPKKASFEIME